ncbi:acyl carrier protein 3, mitochondrial [Mercurialis annua]|uniref:acyl carrier protein 3, mitochondrial n=1 Tax=Mercurialis annua TaxID=3986 RepID=UPI00215E20DA|nr:acyl carrier protein 3, mitochondrial [Mercurialis annua]
MQSLRNSILSHMRLRAIVEQHSFAQSSNEFIRRQMCSSNAANPDRVILDRVIGLVKKFDTIDATKITETADFQKDLCLDSLDRVELVMAFEQEFSIEIPDDQADKLTCCADVAKYIVSGTDQKISSS